METIKIQIENIKELVNFSKKLETLLIQCYNSNLIKKYNIDSFDIFYELKTNEINVKKILDLDIEIMNSSLMSDYMNNEILPKYRNE